MLFAPDVKGMEIILRTSITKAEDKPLQGFIAGQGSSTSGYALYIQEGKVFMDVYQHDMAASVATSQPLPDNFDLMASLTKGGKITIKINGKVAAEGNSHMLFMETLPNTLRTGDQPLRRTLRFCGELPESHSGTTKAQYHGYGCGHYRQDQNFDLRLKFQCAGDRVESGSRNVAI
jgi:hypothetical protein